jgi:hypothetical protein
MNPTAQRPAYIELGCRNRKRNPRAVGVDLLPGDGVDVVAEAGAYLSELPEQSVYGIESEHFLEHILDLPALLHQCGRVLVDGGTFRAVVPHWSNAMYWNDPTHRVPFGLYTFCYFADHNLFRRSVPCYEFDFGLWIDRVDLVFKAPKPFYGRYAFRRIVGCAVNSHRACKEFYEDMLTGFVSCYEIDYQLHRLHR